MIQQKHLYLFIASLISLLVSCSGKMDKAEYAKWVKDYDHGLHAHIAKGAYIFDLQYLPPEYKWLQEGHGQPMEALPEESPIEYYILKVGFKDHSIDLIKGVSEDKNVWEQRAYYFSYQFQDNISLEQDGKHYPCVMFHFEKAFDLRAERNFVLGFAATHAEKSILVIDSPAFGEETIKITINKEDIPTVDL
ncbi:hypothetical protein [Fulvivirga sediminis]|uniref:Lipoprotein n=1 Tax=Fulvivirga sediminis TaxID=2803949 RepID=A0A937F3N4_9BACT|nr:hypothetical protein [Fulvivirga sediminis]MBL3655115.1 hypothetical protein [Fulvivirga sediminis]